MAYNSSHTGAQIDSAVGAVIEKESTWDGKQDEINVSGLVKGNGAGNLSAAQAGTDYAPAYSYGTEDLSAGESPLETGKIYLVYE